MAERFSACSVEGCNGNAGLRAGGRRSLCAAHYRRWTRHGDPLGGGTAHVHHGMRKTRIYDTWFAMLRRCGHKSRANPSSVANYEERGIRVCDDWLDLLKFAEWALSHGYSDCLTIDRIDNDGDYRPENCRFVPMKENSRHRRNHRFDMEDARAIRRLRLNGLRRTEIAAMYGVNPNYVSDIVGGRVWAE